MAIRAARDPGDRQGRQVGRGRPRRSVAAGVASASRARSASSSSGVGSVRRVIRGSVTTLADRVNPSARVTTEAVTPRVHGRLSSDEPNACSISPRGPTRATVRPRGHPDRPGRPAGRAIARPRRRPPRRASRLARPVYGEFPNWLDPRIVARPGRSRDRAARTSIRRRRCTRSMRARTSSSSPRPRPGKSLCYTLPDPPGHRGRSGVAGAHAVPDQGARAGPGHRVRRARRGRRAADVGLDLRRRHAGADPLGHPQRRPGRGDQPGHAPLRDPPPPHEVVPAVRAAQGHRHRRAAHVPRRVRRPRRQRPAPPAPDLRPLRQPPGHRVLLGDHREPRRARGDADRAPGPADRPQRGTGRRASRPARGPAGAWSPRAARAGRR